MLERKITPHSSHGTRDLPKWEMDEAPPKKKKRRIPVIDVITKNLSAEKTERLWREGNTATRRVVESNPAEGGAEGGQQRR